MGRVECRFFPLWIAHVLTGMPVCSIPNGTSSLVRANWRWRLWIQDPPGACVHMRAAKTCTRKWRFLHLPSHSSVQEHTPHTHINNFDFQTWIIGNYCLYTLASIWLSVTNVNVLLNIHYINWHFCFRKKIYHLIRRVNLWKTNKWRMSNLERK